MPRFIVKAAENHYLLWSTIVDAPLTGKGYSLPDARTLFGPEAIADADAGVNDSVFRWNRAGPKETALTREELIACFPVSSTAVQSPRPGDEAIEP